MQTLPSDIVSTLPKSITTTAYGLAALLLCLFPVLSAVSSIGRQPAWLCAERRRSGLYGLFALLFCGCFWFGHGADSINFFLSMLGCAVLFSFVQGKFDRFTFVALFVVLFISRMFIWWRQALGPLTIWDGEMVEIVLILIAVTAVLNDWRSLGSASLVLPIRQQAAARAALVAVLLLVTTAVSFSKVVPAFPLDAFTAWHHWSVYVAPVELLRAGAVPLKDFPVQYGMGPTLLIDLFSGADPWSALGTISSLQLVLQTGLIAAIVCIVVDVRRSLLFFTIALLGSAGACLTWIAWPPELSLATLAPSGCGMRYSPLFLQVLFLLWAGKRIERARMKCVGHCIWVLVSFWAPESMVYSTAVWGPYYLWQCSAPSGTMDLGRAISALINLLVVFGGGVAIFLALFWLQFKTLPTWYGYLAYMIDEPAPLNMAVRGAIWLLLTIFLLTGITLFEALRHRPTADVTRNFFITLCTSLAVLLIFLGRSHENNFLVAIPIIFVMFLCAAAATQQSWLRRAWYALFACSLAYLPVFNFAPWIASFEIDRAAGIRSAFDSTRLTDEMSYMTPAGQRVLDAHRPEFFAKRVNSTDVSAAVTAITLQYHEPITVLDFNFVMLNGEVARGWNGIQDPAAYIPLSPTKRLAFVSATADRLKLPGWFVVNRMWQRRPVLLDDMDSAYDEDKRLEFGTYYAIRFVPKALKN